MFRWRLSKRSRFWFQGFKIKIGPEIRMNKKGAGSILGQWGISFFGSFSSPGPVQYLTAIQLKQRVEGGEVVKNSTWRCLISNWKMKVTWRCFCETYSICWSKCVVLYILASFPRDAPGTLAGLHHGLKDAGSRVQWPSDAQINTWV